MKKINTLGLWILLLSPMLVWSAIEPHSRALWIAETFPLFIGVFVMIKSYENFPLTTFSYFIIFIGAILILIGAHYSYSHVPIGEWAKNIFEFERNNYDKIGHFFQGFIPTIIVREFFLRKRLINSKKWTNFLAITFSIALSALWEIFEWFTVVTLIYFGSTKPASLFLGAQNYFWDAQSDIFFGIIGALTAIIIFGRYHERTIKRLLSIQN